LERRPFSASRRLDRRAARPERAAVPDAALAPDALSGANVPFLRLSLNFRRRFTVDGEKAAHNRYNRRIYSHFLKLFY
jgi:hypothetical protein